MDINGARRMFELQSNAGQVVNAYTAFARQWPKDALILAQARDERLAEVKAEPKMQRRERRENAAALEAMARRTKVVITTAGPYQLYGSALVAACAKAGCDYVDLAGESNWIAEMIGAQPAQLGRAA